MLYNGSKILIEQLKAQGVKFIFGYPGASVLPIYDCLYSDKSIKHVLAVSEAGAVFMADGYARASRDVGVCLATSGPGATNLVTGIASAFMDSVPLVIITGNVPIKNLGHDAFQEVDTSGITMPITKYNYIVKDISKLAFIVSEAFSLANSGRKGPVLIDIPFNIFSETSEYVAPENPVYLNKTIIKEELTNSVNLINSAKRPMIYVGGGVISSGTSNEVIALSEKLNAPIVVSLMGIGAVSTSHPNYVGVGTSKNVLSREILKACDLFICLGARFSNKALELNFASKNTKLLHLDIDRAEIGKNLHADAQLVGDLKYTLPSLINNVSQKSTLWISEVKSMRNSIKTTLTVPNSWINVISKHYGSQQIVATDVGQHQLFVANYYPFDHPSCFISSCGLGSMGYGLGAAIGAHLATSKQVILITGDGSFNMNFNELLTAVNLNIPITIFVFNNHSLGMIRELQSKQYHGRFIASEQGGKLNYARLGEVFGAQGFTAKSPDELASLLKTIDINRPTVIDCLISKNEKSM
ncbi:MAG: thiamine pyrophosphate-binding protein [Clostridia bacterium]